MGWFAEARNPGLKGIPEGMLFRNCSTSEIARLIADHEVFKPIFDRGVFPKPPLEESIVLETVTPGGFIIRAGTRNQRYWSYLVSLEQDDDDVYLYAEVENPTRAAFPRWYGNIDQFNRTIAAMRV